MHLVQIFIPELSSIHEKKYSETRNTLIDKFGGLTEYDKAPASGFWEKDANEPIVRDQMIIYEVQCETLDSAWWREFRTKLEKLFDQDTILIRSQLIEIL